MMDKNLLCSYASIFHQYHAFQVTWSGAKKCGSDINWNRENLSHFFTELLSSRGREFSVISRRGTDKEKQFKLLVLCFILTGQVKRLIGFKQILSSQEHRRFNSNRPFPSSFVLLLQNDSMCETFHIKISPHAVSISCKSKSKEWFRT